MPTLLETPLEKAKRHVLEAEEQLIARIDLIATLASRGLDTAEAEARLVKLKQTLDLMYESLALLQENMAAAQYQAKQ